MSSPTNVERSNPSRVKSHLEELLDGAARELAEIEEHKAPKMAEVVATDVSRALLHTRHALAIAKRRGL